MGKGFVSFLITLSATKNWATFEFNNCPELTITQRAKIRPIWSPRDRCYDFKNIFVEKFCKKVGVFDSKQS
jgi:hypothetical protein